MLDFLGVPKNLRNSYFKGIVLLVLVLGIMFRLGNLDVKPYWEDEVYTSMRISGYQSDLLKKEVIDKAIQVETLSQYLDVNSGKSWIDTSIALVNKPEHTPLYFLLARAWAELFGSSISAMRAFPALVSLLSLPLFYWFALLLFESPTVASTTVCLASVSPIMIRYAQEARPYSLWIVCILLSSIMLLRALRLDTRRSWICYSATISLAFLTHLLSGFVFLVHSLYVLILLRFDWLMPKARSAEKISDLSPSSENLLNKQKLQHYFKALGVGLLPLLPWFILLISRLSSVQKAAHWLNEDQPLTELFFKWVENIIRIFSSPFPSPDIRLFFFAIPLCILLAWSVFRMISKSHVRGWLLPILLCIIPMGIFMVSDLLLGGQRSTIMRYLLPSYIGSLLIFGFGLSFNYIESHKHSKNHAFAKGVIFYAILIVAISASWFNLQSPTWWGTESSYEISTAQAIIDTSNQAIVVSDESFGDFMSFAFLLRPTDHILWLKPHHNLNEGYIVANSGSIFLWRPSESLLDKAKSLAEKRKFMIETVSSNDVFQIKTHKEQALR
ncbi:MAG: glycosyltransferase family 39 protein [Xenococcus sp. MO_188.B8]|nr:glycosyltransferase family 39 protein [Xenococcus sp. MO_188.B8]